MHTAYGYHPQTGSFTGAVQYRPDPIDGTAPPPAHSTMVKPPEAAEKQIAVWEGGAWMLKPDHRGAEYWLADGSRHLILQIGDVPPEDALDAPPPPPFDQAQARAMTLIDQHHAEMLTSATGGATSAERDTWTVKAAAAVAYLADSASPAQAAMIEAEGGDDPDALAQRIVEKSDAFQMLVGIAGGIRATAREAVRVATTHEQIDAALSAAQEAAQAALAAALQEA